MFGLRGPAAGTSARLLSALTRAVTADTSALRAPSLAACRCLSYAARANRQAQPTHAAAKRNFQRPPPSNQKIPAGNSVQGVVERVTFANQENGWCVLRIAVDKQKELTTVVGVAPGVAVGQHVTAEGQWVKEKSWGVQMQARSIELSSPQTVDGMARYLSSGLIKGIGPVYGNRMVERFGAQVFDVIENQPERLMEISGIGKGRLAKIKTAWLEQQAVREIMVYLHAHGVGSTFAQRIYKKYGERAIEFIERNPYSLAADVRGIGFKTADKLAQSIGLDVRSMERVRAGVAHALLECKNAGHCGLPRDELIHAAVKVLEVESELVDQGLQLALQEETVVSQVVDNTECVFHTSLFKMEQRMAQLLVQLSKSARPWPEVDTSSAMGWVEKEEGIELAPSQRDAVLTALNSKLLVITGGPGTGKTTLLKSVLMILQVKKVKMLLAAPTGRAAKRMTDSTGLPASTIHRMLGSGKGGWVEGSKFEFNEYNHLKCDLLVVDEASMIDVDLMHAMLRALPSTAALILVGDVDQLPSVGPGRVLGDVIDSGAVPVVKLTEVFRQAADSSIVTNAHRINRGQQPLVDVTRGDKNDFFVWRIDGAGDGPSVEEHVLHMVCDRIPEKFGLDPLTDVQVLAPRNTGSAGTSNLNEVLQARLNPPRDGVESVVRFGTIFRVGDKVMNVLNNIELQVWNGDMGTVEAIDQVEELLTVRFEDGKAVPFEFGDLDNLTLAYCTSIHKSQGSEYPAVVLPLTMQAYTMLQRNLLYTGVTRGKRLVVLIAEDKALRMAVSTRNSRRRWSMLRDLLVAAAAR